MHSVKNYAINEMYKQFQDKKVFIFEVCKDKKNFLKETNIESLGDNVVEENFSIWKNAKYVKFEINKKTTNITFHKGKW